jgi:hypothetical protein
MRYFKILIIFAWAGSIAALSSPATPVCAQSNPPFQNPSLDSDCYFPQIGDPSEMDTILGSDTNQSLGGAIIKNLGTKPNGGYGNMFIENLTRPPNEYTHTLSQVATGPSFNLHNMVQSVQKFNDNSLNNLSAGYHLGHFRDRAHLDIFVGEDYSAGIYGKIFWADDDGNYDTTRFTVLIPNIRKGNFISNGGIGNGPILPYYIAHLTSDTVDDIVTSAFSDYINDQDTAYALLFQGGQELYSKDTAFEDTSAMMYPMKPNGAAFRDCTQADFRGVGRDDLIVSDDLNNLCYYKNDPPFSLSQFAQAVGQDTIFAAWQDSHIESTGAINTWFTMRALPKAPDDQSVDFMPVFRTNNDSTNNGIFIFRGGPDFGSHRFTLDMSFPRMSGRS